MLLRIYNFFLPTARRLTERGRRLLTAKAFRCSLVKFKMQSGPVLLFRCYSYVEKCCRMLLVEGEISYERN